MMTSAATTSENLIANASVETATPSNSASPQTWQQGGWGSNQPKYSYLGTGQDGSHSVSVQITSYTSGDAKWYFTPVSIQPSSQYTFSDYYKSDVETDVVAQFDDGHGNYTYQGLGVAPSSADWKQYTTSFSAPGSAVHVTVFHLINSVGTLTTDNFSLSATTTTPPTTPPTTPTDPPVSPPTTPPATNDNLIANGSVETANSSNSALPQNWKQDRWGTNTASYSYVNGGQDGSRSMQVQITSYTSGDAKWYFDPVDVQAGSEYTFSDYYKSNIENDVVAQFEDSSGNYSYVDLGSASASVDWKQYSATFTAPVSVVRVTVFHLINKVGSLTTDNFSLTGASTTTPPPSSQNANLISNASTEAADPNNSSLPQTWHQNKWGTNTASYSYLNTGQDGSRSVQINMSSHNSGDAKWYFTPVKVQSGEEYTFSDYYKSTVQTDVVVQFEDSSGNYTYLYLGAAPISANWKQYSATFTVPESIARATVFHVINSVGTLTTDNFSLKATDTSSPPPPASDNLITNSSAEASDPNNSSLAQGWHHDSWGANSPVYSYLNDGQDGSRSMQVQITSYASGDAKWYFDPVKVQTDSQYSFSDYYKSTVSTRVYAAFTMSDGSMLYQIIGQPAAASGWQQFSTHFSLPEGAVNVTVYHLINQVGTLTTDNYSLTPYTPSGFNRPLVSLAFDDSYQSTYDNGLPLLEKYDFASTQYIISGLIGQSAYMTKAEVLDWHAKGHEIASHTVTHPDLTHENSSQLNTELIQSQATLESWIGQPVTNISYPYGLYDEAVISATKQHYIIGRGVEDGFNSKDNFNPYDIRVQNISDSTTAAQVVDWVTQAQQTNTWLVLVYHSVDSNPNVSYDPAGNVTPEQLDTELAAIKASGITVKTIQQAFAEVTSQL
jgi:peptidoglycan/xylan/chitin deacetylase (PgdA/CDA1 family)